MNFYAKTRGWRNYEHLSNYVLFELQSRSSLFAMGTKIALQFEFQMERCAVIKQETDNPILFKFNFLPSRQKSLDKSTNRIET